MFEILEYLTEIHFFQDLEVIFSNILDIYNFTANMLGSVEEQVEVAAENETPTVGICFQDIAEVSWYLHQTMVHHESIQKITLFIPNTVDSRYLDLTYLK